MKCTGGDLDKAPLNGRADPNTTFTQTKHPYNLKGENMRDSIVNFIYWLNCKLGEHRIVYGSFLYNPQTKLYYPHQTICRDCGKLFEVGL